MRGGAGEMQERMREGGVPLPARRAVWAVYFLLFNIKMEHFDVVFQLDLTEENCVKTHNLYNLTFGRKTTRTQLPHTDYAWTVGTRQTLCSIQMQH